MLVDQSVRVVLPSRYPRYPDNHPAGAGGPVDATKDSVLIREIAAQGAEPPPKMASYRGGANFRQILVHSPAEQRSDETDIEGTWKHGGRRVVR